ncbi:MAG: ATP-binding protein [Actinomycetota bacterium]
MTDTALPVPASSRRPFIIAAIAALVLAAVDFSWIHWQFGGERATQWWSDLVAIPVPLSTAVACWFVARRTQGRARRAWTLLGAAALSWALGEAIWSFYELGLDREVPFPSLADLGYLGLIPLAVAGLLAFPSVPRRITSQARTLFDGLIIVGSLLFVSWGTVLGPTYREGAGSGLEKIIGVAYPIGDVALLSIVLFIAARAARGHRSALGFIGAGLVLLAFADSGFIYQNLHETYASGSLIDPLWEIGFLLMMLGAVLALGRPAEITEDDHRPGRLGALLPYGAVALVIILAAAWSRATPLEPFLFWNMLVVVVFVVARQLFTLLDNLALTRNLEDRVRDLARTNAALIEGVSDYAIFALSTDGRVRTWNAGAQHIKGWRAEEVVGRHFSCFYTPEDVAVGRPRANLELAVKQGRSEQEGWRLRKDGSRFFANVVMTPLIDDDGTLRGFSNVTRDITERVRAQQEREELQMQLNHSRRLESLGHLAGGVAHDFNNILGIILGFAGLTKGDMDRHLSALPDDARASLVRNLDQIERAADRAATLTKQLLTFSRREAVTPRIVDLNAIIRDIEELLRRSVRETIELRFSLAPDLALIKADPAQIEQVLTNLAVNARDAMPEGGSLTIETSNDTLDEFDARMNPGVNPGKHVRLRVSDTGIGMEDNVAAHAFEPFFTTKPKGLGTGLGLATVYGIVRQSGGTITVRSVPGRGTTFTIHIPASEHASPSGVESPAPREQFARSGETVLVVEDNASMLELVSLTLSDKGYRVLAAANGSEAISIAEQSDPPIDLLLTDVVMPQMSGPELISYLHRARPDLPAICMSGYAESISDPGDAGEGVRFIGKPFTPEQLLALVRETLQARMTQR